MISLGDRRLYIGWSDIGTICGHNSRETGYTLAQEKLGHTVPDTEKKLAMRMGHLLEPVLGEFYVEQTGRQIMPSAEVVHPELPWLIGHPDYLVVKQSPHMGPPLSGMEEPTRYVECKATRLFDEWGDAGTDDVPKTALCQALAGCTIMDLDLCDLPMMRYCTAPEIFYVARDDELWKAILRKVVAWHQLVMIERKLPDPETLGDYKIAFPEHTPGAFGTYDVATMREDFARYRRLTAIETVAKKGKEFIKAKYIPLIGAAEGIAHFDEDDSAAMVPVVTYKKSKGRFNQKAFAADHPDLVEQYTDEVGPRIFNICTNKDALRILGPVEEHQELIQ